MNLYQANDLSKNDGAVRLEGNGLPNRVIVVNSGNGNFKAYENKCTHMGRRVDPVPETETVQCCSVNCATFDQKGEVLDGPAKKPLKTYAVAVKKGELIIDLK